MNDGNRLKVDLHGVTKTVTTALEHVDHEVDLCGGYRRGFVGTTIFVLSDYRIDYELGPASQEVELLL